MEKKPIKIAVDGPAGAGKSTVAKEVAKKLKIEYIDTGAMYRTVAYHMLKRGIEKDDEGGINSVLSDSDLKFDLKDEIRTEEVGNLASDISALKIVRQKLVLIQRKMGEEKSVIMDGRDIGTNVFKDADYKFYLTASLDERAKRRTLDLKSRGIDKDFNIVREEIEKRDYNDQNRALDPLKIADDAVVIDSTDMSIDEVVDFIVKTCE